MRLLSLRALFNTQPVSLSATPVLASAHSQDFRVHFKASVSLYASALLPHLLFVAPFGRRNSMCSRNTFCTSSRQFGSATYIPWWPLSFWIHQSLCIAYYLVRQMHAMAEDIKLAYGGTRLLYVFPTDVKYSALCASWSDHTSAVQCLLFQATWMVVWPLCLTQGVLLVSTWPHCGNPCDLGQFCSRFSRSMYYLLPHPFSPAT